MTETVSLKKRDVQNSTETLPKICIILINYNNWIDTLECMESVLRLDYPNFEIVCVENGSTDASLERLKQWADGKLAVWLPPEHPHRTKIIPAVEDKTVQIIQTGTDGTGFEASGALEDPVITVLCSPENSGAAGGNNIGLKWASRNGNFDYLWMINNDTVVDAKALRNLVRYVAQNPGIGICGSHLKEYLQTEQTQVWGARISPYTGKTFHFTDAGKLSKMNYIIGASFFVSRECREKIGLLKEEYFIYNEETDYCFRARENGFRLAIAPDSVIYHKQGKGTDSLSRDYYVSRNMLYFGRIFYPQFKWLWIVFFWVQIVFPKLIRGQWKRLRIVFKALRDYRRGKMGRLQ